jgi:transcriptional regulator with XRE-family HTH domain
MHKDKHPASEQFLLNLGDAIRARRINLFLSQEQLGSRANLHRTYVTDVENGLRNISMITLLRIAKALKSRPSTSILAAEKATNHKNGKDAFN